MRIWDFRGLMAVALVLSITFVTMPLSAADFSTTRAVIGSVSGVGPVALRGVSISQDGTLFSGDSIRSGVKGYVKVLIGTGSKIELQEKTDLSVKQDSKGIQIAMNTGTVGFTAHNPLRIDVAPFEVTASDDASANVAIMSPTTAGVRAINGKVMVRNLKTSESFVLTQGHEQLLKLQDGTHSPSLGELASNVPGPVPAPTPAPQTPAGKTTGGLAMDTGAWLAVIGGAAVAGIAVWGVLRAHRANERIDGLTEQLAATNQKVAANNVATQAQLKLISNAAAVSNTTAQQQAQLASIAALAGQAQLALSTANPGQAAAAASISSQATASATRLATLQSQIQALQAQLASGSGSQQQLQNLLNQEEIERQNSNNLANQLNTLLNNNRNVTGVPGGSVGTVGPPGQSSASIPV